MARARVATVAVQRYRDTGKAAGTRAPSLTRTRSLRSRASRRRGLRVTRSCKTLAKVPKAKAPIVATLGDCVTVVLSLCQGRIFPMPLRQYQFGAAACKALPVKRPIITGIALQNSFPPGFSVPVHRDSQIRVAEELTRCTGPSGPRVQEY
eukprot:1696782-Rhodomonas_salina.1